MPWKVTVRAGPRVVRRRYEALDEALNALHSEASELARAAPRRPVDVKMRRFDPVQQVAARIELAGPQRLSPNIRAGVDVRGDGSTEAFLGRLRRRVIELRPDEDACSALARAVRSRTA